MVVSGEEWPSVWSIAPTQSNATEMSRHTQTDRLTDLVQLSYGPEHALACPLSTTKLGGCTIGILGMHADDVSRVLPEGS